MRIAIIGAGIAGLACAHELEKLGVISTIFEKNSFIGEAYPHVAAPLSVMNRPIKDSTKYYYEQFGIKIEPLNTINTIIHHSPNVVKKLKGDFGRMFIRDKNQDQDLKKQIFSQLKNTEIRFNEFGDYKELSSKYDYVVVANGDWSISEELGCWHTIQQTYSKGAVVSGDFDPNTVMIWFNKDYCKNGYAYAIPFNSKSAALILNVTDVSEEQVEDYWKLFLIKENIKYTINEEYKYQHKTGHVYPHKLNNIFLIGNAGGALDTLLGFGQLNSIIMSVMDARSIVTKKNFEMLIEQVTKSNVQKYKVRKLLDKATNRDYDKIVKFISLPGIKQVIYDSNIDVLKYLSLFI